MRPIEGEHPYIFVDGVYLKRSWGGEVQNVSVLVAVGINSEGYREILGVAEGSREDKESWQNFLRYLKDRGLHGVKLVVSDKSTGLVEVLGDCLPRGEMAAVRGPLVSQCVCEVSEAQIRTCGGDVEGHPCSGGQGCGTSESLYGRRETPQHETEQCRGFRGEDG